MATSPRASSRYFTIEDAKASFNLFCCVYGIGTLGMPGNFARAGPVCGIVALAYMGLVNVYASVKCSRVMLLAPRSVKTFADLGEFALGPRGRVAVVMSQMGVCLFVPCAFLVLGGKLLDVIIPDAFPPVMWSILMSISILPIALIPTMKEGAGAALAGCLGTILADFMALGVLVHHLYHATPVSVPTPAISFDSIASTFGNLSLAYGAAIVIPDLQRQHSQPSRMPRVVFVTMTIVTVLFVAIASTGYAMVGCQIPGNLLFAISGPELGFTAERGVVVLAFMAMQLHITIGFSVLLHPAFYYAEQAVLGLHTSPPPTFQALSDSDTCSTSDNDHDSTNTFAASHSNPSKLPRPADAPPHPPSAMEAATLANPAESDENDDASSLSGLRTQSSSSVSSTLPDEEDVPKSDSSSNLVACCILRTSMVAALTVVSVVLHDHFHELVDLVGASSVSLSCIVLPILCYLKVCHADIGFVERAFCYFTIGVCSVLSMYVTVQSGRQLLASTADHIVFPYCPLPYQHVAYTNATFYSNTIPNP
ncbi:hypothetical protein DYB25_000417 [Aphanomyces astaci]|uniref:Amino acid transporter transmembrane domain-containing protein n=1 Tax=Aphanomyces astaci TaxID=112090 RepID=A0A397AMF5_APHAT|nr:hypothetical protein DYB25_000417 [Aphanomyces astaci]RHY53087.1 hypothetical protein DYB30_003918 [Aphanomyces astaci]RHY68708.1 hypothetical protein DYB34_000268 [Aphanomyces astaci]RHY69756.1 hypothetical protein DYB38_008034 [Aphanomyces astaci]RHY99534.1 hypothetical protein DYB26_000196 [Aphanomyces astaci]